MNTEREPVMRPCSVKRGRQSSHHYCDSSSLGLSAALTLITNTFYKIFRLAAALQFRRLTWGVRHGFADGGLTPYTSDTEVDERDL